MDDNNYRVIKISKDALFEFIYEKFIEEQECYLDVDPIEVMDNFDIDYVNGKFIFIAKNAEDANGNIVPFSNRLDTKKLLEKMDDTTKSMFSSSVRYKDFTLDELLDIQNN